MICFPYIFRGALDVSSSAINEEMKVAAVHAIAKPRARAAPPTSSPRPYGGQSRLYGKGQPDFPRRSTPRLILRIAPAVAKAAMDSGDGPQADPGFPGVSGSPVALRVPLPASS